jgi:hypothetical protein
METGRCRHRERRRIIRPVAPAEHPPKQTTGRWCDQGTVERSHDTVIDEHPTPPHRPTNSAHAETTADR